MLLGRDFLSPALIGIHIGCEGWSIGLRPESIYPFVQNSSLLVALTEVEEVSALSDSSNQLSISNSEISVVESPIIELEEPDLISFADDEQNPYEYY